MSAGINIVLRTSMPRMSNNFSSVTTRNCCHKQVLWLRSHYFVRNLEFINFF